MQFQTGNFVERFAARRTHFARFLLVLHHVLPQFDDRVKGVGTEGAFMLRNGPTIGANMLAQSNFPIECRACAGPWSIDNF